MTAIDFSVCTSLPAMFFQQAERFADRPFLWTKRKRDWVPMNWGEAAEQIRALARGLLSLGVEAGDRVVLMAENRPEWLIADMAIMTAGAITVPAYTSYSPTDILHVLNNSGARLAIVSTRQQAERLVAAALSAHLPPTVIAMEPLAFRQHPGLEIHGWAETLVRGRAREDDTDRLVAALRRGDTACIIHTSGTGGAPKGAMLSHGAIISNCWGAYNLLLELGLDEEVFLSFLPLSHAYEHTAGQYFPISIGAQIYYAESIDQLAADMVEARPTIMTAVPRLYEAMHARIMRNIERTGGRRARWFLRAVALGARRYEDPDGLSLAERLEDKALDLLVRRRVAARFGGRLKAMVSGGAPLAYDIGLFFTALGLRILQGFGQTEAGPVISCNPPSRIKLDTVGPPLRGVEVRIAADGEILVRGELVMKGYWDDPETTARTIRHGWLHTGDVGWIDDDGFIHITDRKKDIIVSSGGDNISPQRIEGLLTLQPEIAQAMVYGDRRPHLVALLVPEAEAAAHWAARSGHARAGTPEELVDDPDFRRLLADAVERVNGHLSPPERIRRFVLTAEPFSVDNEMCTPTLKIRRHAIIAHYGRILDSLYE